MFNHPGALSIMNAFLRTSCAVTVAAATALLLSACGGGNDDDPTPSDQLGVLTVTGATVEGLNGIYGDGNVNLTDVDKKNPIGSYPEVCTFRFDGVNRVGGSGQAFGDIRYRPDASVVYEAFFTFLDHEFRADDWSDVAVVRDTDRIRLVNKTLVATDGSGARVTVSGVVPMRPNRPSGC